MLRLELGKVYRFRGVSYGPGTVRLAAGDPAISYLKAVAAPTAKPPTSRRKKK